MLCKRPIPAEPDLVYGSEIDGPFSSLTLDEYPYYERQEGYGCGPKGKYWEKKK